MKCSHSFAFTHQEPNGEDRVFKHYQCRHCPKTMRRNVKKARFTSRLRKQPLTKPRKQLRARNPKRAAQEAEYLRRRIPFLEAHPICPITGQPTTQIHHKAGREGIWLLREEYWMAVSDEGHDKIEKNRKWATAMGYLLPRRPSK